MPETTTTNHEGGADSTILDIHEAHLEKVGADIASDEKRLTELRRKISRRSFLGLSLPGTSKLRVEASGLDAALRFSWIEEAHTQLDIAREREMNLPLVAEESNSSDSDTTPFTQS